LDKARNIAMSQKVSAGIFNLRVREQGARHGEQGFTLVEMLVVITIIGLIMGLIGPRVLNYLSESKVKAAKIQMQSFGSALDLFSLDAGRYPSTAEGLGGGVSLPP
jgi:general secretion pathway protein G